MKKNIKLTESKEITNSCGKKGCKLYVLPFAATKEAFQKFVDLCVEDQKVQEEVINEI
jgi:hypothetical protein